MKGNYSEETKCSPTFKCSFTNRPLANDEERFTASYEAAQGKQQHAHMPKSHYEYVWPNHQLNIKHMQRSACSELKIFLLLLFGFVPGETLKAPKTTTAVSVQRLLPAIGAAADAIVLREARLQPLTAGFLFPATARARDARVKRGRQTTHAARRPFFA